MTFSIIKKGKLSEPNWFDEYRFLIDFDDNIEPEINFVALMRVCRLN